MAARVGAPASAPTARPGITLPNQTLYINNLNDKVSKQVLRSELYVLCSQFGSVLDVVALKTDKMRGQAFVVFQQLTGSSDLLACFRMTLRVSGGSGFSRAPEAARIRILRETDEDSVLQDQVGCDCQGGGHVCPETEEKDRIARARIQAAEQEANGGEST
eukprot:764506-Hanusia_phi.AAC.1